MSDTGETDTGLTGNTVRCWETGERWPDSRFSEHQRWVIVDHQFRTRMLGQRVVGLNAEDGAAEVMGPD